MRADIRERISQQTERESKRSTIIIITLSTLLILAFVALAVMKTETIENPNNKVKTVKQALMEEEEYQERKARKTAESIANNRLRSQQARERRAQQIADAQSKPNFPKAITLEDLPPSSNPITFYTPPKYNNVTSSTTQTRTNKKSIPNSVGWRWVTGSGKSTDIDTGLFYYTVTNGTINTATVCNNYSNGSFKYRNCRKAAKQWFKEKCSQSFKAACTASGMRP